MNTRKYFIYAVTVILSALSIFPAHAMGRKSKDEKAPSRTAISQTQLEASNRLKTESNETLDLTWDVVQGTPAFVKGDLRVISGDLETGVREFLSDFRDLYRLTTPTDELVLIKNETDELQITHLKFSQVYQNLPVFQQELIAHVRADGMLYTVNGHTIATPSIKTVPAVPEAQAVQVAEADVLGRKPNNKLESKKQLGILVEETKSRLIWEVRVSSPTNLLIGEIIYVDAQTGKIIRRGTTVMSDGPRVGDGIGVLGQNRSLNTYQVGPDYYLIDASRPMYVPPVDSLRGVIVTYDAHNTEGSNVTQSVDPNDDNHWNDSQYLRANVDAHYHLGKTFQFYQQAFNRNSWNNQGGSLVGAAHWGANLNNAFWNGQAMVFGDGDGSTFRAFPASYDVCVHEVSHGVTQASSNLQYLRQSGAMNEHMSDAMAMVADSANWLIGDDIVLISPFFARSFSDPHQGLDWQPSHMSEYQNLPDDNDHGGVHTNSGIPNHAFYLAATALNRRQAGSIWYRANNNYLTQTSQFIDLRNACVQAATDLYGGGSPAVNAVNNAFNQVGIGGGGPGNDVLFEDFEDTAPDWGAYTIDGNFGVTWDINNSNSHSGSLSAWCTYGSIGEFQDEWLVSPAFQVTQPTATLSYYTLFIEPQYANDNHYVKIGTDLGNINSFVNIQTITIANMQQMQGNWTLQTINLSGFSPGTNYYLVFEYRGTYAESWLVDDVRLSTSQAADEPINLLPTQIELSEAYPNPFNPSTSLEYTVSATAPVKLTVYNLLGEVVEELYNGIQTPGVHKIFWNGDKQSSGLYFAHLESENTVLVRKLVLLK